MPPIRVENVFAAHGWAVDGLLGGVGPLASVLFRSTKDGREVTVGIDLDKPRLLSEPPVSIDRTGLYEIANALNRQRRRLLFGAGESFAPHSR